LHKQFGRSRQSSQTALRSRERSGIDLIEFNELGDDSIERSHLPPWGEPSALEVVAWQFKGITEALFALRDRMGGSPNADEGKR
jgi:hypothetical protein